MSSQTMIFTHTVVSKSYRIPVQNFNYCPTLAGGSNINSDGCWYVSVMPENLKRCLENPKDAWEALRNHFE